jgi:hypothetical protein
MRKNKPGTTGPGLFLFQEPVHFVIIGHTRTIGVVAALRTYIMSTEGAFCA